MRTKVFITIDTEFSIGGAFADPARNAPVGAQNVLCSIGERSEGLQFLLDTFEQNDVKATFFIETLQSAFFGDEPMGGIARAISQAGHDAQLHLHPVWTYFDHPDWQSRLAVETPRDNLHDRTGPELLSWMRRGQQTFQRWGLAAPVALRTGNLMVDRTVYQAMAQAGLTVASNVGRAVFEPADLALRVDAGMHLIDGIIEIPVLTYADFSLGGRERRKCLTITGSSFREARYLLDRAQADAIEAIVVLTHCHEFVRGDMHGTLTPNRVNQRRLQALCRYLGDSADRFEVSTMAAIANEAPAARGRSGESLKVPAHLAIPRMISNRLNDLGLFGK